MCSILDLAASKTLAKAQLEVKAAQRPCTVRTAHLHASGTRPDRSVCCHRFPPSPESPAPRQALDHNGRDDRPHPRLSPSRKKAPHGEHPERRPRPHASTNAQRPGAHDRRRPTFVGRRAAHGALRGALPGPGDAAAPAGRAARDTARTWPKRAR